MGIILVSGCVEPREEIKTELDLKEANVVGVEFTKEGGKYTFSVTIRHNDEGWEHYVDWWRSDLLPRLSLGASGAGLRRS